jgi:hypothetical protein
MERETDLWNHFQRDIQISSYFKYVIWNGIFQWEKKNSLEDQEETKTTVSLVNH